MGLSLPFERWGHGPKAAVLLHGFTGRASSFAPLRPELESVLSVRALELPGHGEVPAATFDATLDAVAAALSSPAVLLGYSQGARLALATALLRPASLTHLVLESVNPGLRTAAERAARRADDERRALTLQTEGLAAFLKQWDALPLLAGSHHRPERQTHHPAALAAALRQLGLAEQPDLWPLLPRLKVPTLLITGERDQKFTALATQAAALLPLGQHVVIASAGHAPHFEQPEAYARALINFLQPIPQSQETSDDPRMES